MSRKVKIWIASLAALALTLVPAAGQAPPQCPAEAERPEARAHEVRSFDGTVLSVRSFRPAGACEARPVPVVLVLQPWAGSAEEATTGRGHAPAVAETVQDNLRALLARGFGVVAADARGHGDTRAPSHFLSPDHEIRDLRVIIDWISEELGWVRADASEARRDVRIAAVGFSYGGTTGLLMASDPRVDAVVSIAGWHDLASSDAAVPIVRAIGKVAQDEAVRMEPVLRDLFGATQTSGAIPPELYPVLRRASPAAGVGNARVPRLLVHGERDEVIPLPEAIRNYQDLRADGAPVRLLVFPGGHSWPMFAVPQSAPPGSTVVSCDRSSPVLDFLSTYLYGDRSAAERLRSVPNVAYVLPTGACVPAEGWIETGQASFSIGTPTSDPHSVQEPS